MSHGWKERNQFYNSTNLVYYHIMYKGWGMSFKNSALHCFLIGLTNHCDFFLSSKKASFPITSIIEYQYLYHICPLLSALPFASHTRTLATSLFPFPFPLFPSGPIGWSFENKYHWCKLDQNLKQSNNTHASHWRFALFGGISEVWLTVKDECLLGSFSRCFARIFHSRIALYDC